MTVVRRFAGITPEVIENVRTGEKAEGWLALSHAPGGGIGAKAEHAGVCGSIPLHTSTCAAVLEPGSGYRSRGSVIPHAEAMFCQGRQNENAD